jgi:hypothetical protein
VLLLAPQLYSLRFPLLPKAPIQTIVQLFVYISGDIVFKDVHRLRSVFLSCCPFSCTLVQLSYCSIGLCTILSVLSCAIILASLPGLTNLWTNIHESNSRRQKAAETPAPFHQPSTKQKSPDIGLLVCCLVIGVLREVSTQMVCSTKWVHRLCSRECPTCCTVGLFDGLQLVFCRAPQLLMCYLKRPTITRL